MIESKAVCMYVCMRSHWALPGGAALRLVVPVAYDVPVARRGFNFDLTVRYLPKRGAECVRDFFRTSLANG